MIELGKHMKQMKHRSGMITAGLAAAGAAVTALAVAGTASASVTFDPATGTGFVGKGDVQTAFGWNNQQLQNSAAGVTFSYDATDVYSAVCTWITGEGTKGEKTHDISVPRHSSVNSVIAYDARTHKQIDGFTLTGFAGTTTTGTVPVVGNSCVGNSDGINFNGTWTSVSLVSSDATLSTVYGGNSVVVWP
ncbi:hypothetical protein [Streptomyces sp. MK7]|uniref:hypothetical protein n=1 Tax=Streptomyces sp. MK7 TaxID=3067635 RepID=UPI00292DC9A7|nr:hypothetical protein [Streptomyces sp. MK7]